jgi:DNA modification methylase
MGALQMNTANLILGDCTQELKKLDSDSVDLVLTDPPYNIGQGNKLTKIGNKIVSNAEAFSTREGKWDDMGGEVYEKLIRDCLKEYFRVLKDGGGLYIFTAREMNGVVVQWAKEYGFTYRNTIALIKDTPLPSYTGKNFRSGFELACYLVKGEKAKTFNFLSQRLMKNTFNYMTNNTKESDHPTQKPIPLLEWLIKINSNKDDLVLDSFMGSGSCGVACLKNGRNFIGIEKDEGYFVKAKKWIEGYLNQTKLRGF